MAAVTVVHLSLDVPLPELAELTAVYQRMMRPYVKSSTGIYSYHTPEISLGPSDGTGSNTPGLYRTALKTPRPSRSRRIKQRERANRKSLSETASVELTSPNSEDLIRPKKSETPSIADETVPPPEKPQDQVDEGPPQPEPPAQDAPADDGPPGLLGPGPTEQVKPSDALTSEPKKKENPKTSDNWKLKYIEPAKPLPSMAEFIEETKQLSQYSPANFTPAERIDHKEFLENGYIYVQDPDGTGAYVSKNDSRPYPGKGPPSCKGLENLDYLSGKHCKYLEWVLKHNRNNHKWSGFQPYTVRCRSCQIKDPINYWNKYRAPEEALNRPNRFSRKPLISN